MSRIIIGKRGLLIKVGDNSCLLTQVNCGLGYFKNFEMQISEVIDLCFPSGML